MGKCVKEGAVACGKRDSGFDADKKDLAEIPPQNDLPHQVFRMKVEGAENVPKEGPVLLCSNHLAKRDPVLLGLSQKRQVFYMAKEELFQSKFLGRLFRMLGAFPVKRGTGGSDALEDAYALLKQNAVVGVFIEGHRSKDGLLRKPKTGTTGALVS